MKGDLVIIGCLLTFFFMGCSMPPVVMPAFRTEYPVGIEPTAIVEAAVFVLQERGFTFTVVNPALGLVVTDWRVATTPKEEATMGVLSSLVYSPLHPSYGDTRKERIQLSVMVDKSAQMLIMKPVKRRSSRISGWSDINLDNGDKRMLRSITTDIAMKLGAPIAINWLEILAQEPPEQPRRGVALVVFGVIVLTMVLVSMDG